MTDGRLFNIGHVMTGPLRAFGERNVLSGIDKRPVATPLYLGIEGFETDTQGDRKHHGGPDKAVHHYPFDHYADWREELGEREVLRQPGAFGENLSTVGLTESDVAYGDVFRLGHAILSVSQGRQPCWKLNLRLDHPHMARRVQETGRTGWYYRVVTPGIVQPGDRLERLERPFEAWTIARIGHILYVDVLNIDELSGLSQLPGLPESWKRLADKRLTQKTVEDWTPRLTPPPV